MIRFVEDSSPGYRNRTYINAAGADITLAFAVNFSTPGEILTKKAVLSSGKLYYPIPIKIENWEETVNDLANILLVSGCHTLNIAGNGIYTLSRYGISQEMCDNFVLNTLLKLIKQYSININFIRSGGQTGADEAGIKAAEALGIDSECYFPKGWRFRTVDADYSDENLFKIRFYEENKVSRSC